MRDMSSAHGNQKATDDEIIDAVKAVDEPVASASEVAAALGMTRTGVNTRMKKLRDEGKLDKKNVGKGYVWWVCEGYDDSER
jgi:biotin operon repressor